ncbi:Odorant receptor 53, partial [Frankliniella occidentalis]
MDEWLHHLGEENSAQRSKAVILLKHLRESSLSFFATVLLTLLAGVDTAALVARGDPLSVRVPVRTFVAAYSCVIAQFILR